MELIVQSRLDSNSWYFSCFHFPSIRLEYVLPCLANDLSFLSERFLNVWILKMHYIFLVRMHCIVHKHPNHLSRMSSLHIHTMHLLRAVTWEAPWNWMESARACMPIDGTVGFFSQCDLGSAAATVQSGFEDRGNICITFSPWPAAQVPSGVISLFFHDHRFYFRMFSKAISRNCTKNIELTSETEFVFNSSLCEMSQNFWIQWLWKILSMIYFLQIFFHIYMYSVFCASHFLLRELGLQMITITLYLLPGLWRFEFRSLCFHSKCFDPLTCLWVVPAFILCLSTPELSVWI